MPELKTNDEQILAWNEKSGPKWVAMQERLDAQIQPFSDVMLGRVALKPGERVLDIGCGCGATTLDAAARVRPGGSCTGVDVSRPMLARARERAKETKASNAEFVEGDAQSFAFKPEYDAVISRFGVMFFADSTAAFTNIRRALKPAGRLCFICWRPMKENPWMSIPLGAAAKHVQLPPPPADPNAPGPFAFGDSERVRGILDSAGFTGVQIDRFDVKLPIGGSSDVDGAVHFSIELGPVSGLLNDKSDDVRQAVRGSMKEALKPFLTPKGVVLDWAAWLVSARNA